MASASPGGRFLRGQKWEKFSVRDARADFYVSPDGDDAWSGSLPDPAAAGDDGPFATIDRSQEAVRDLKRQAFYEKKPPVEARFIGSPHKYGRGQDILVLLRGGQYFLDRPLRFGADDGGERVETDLPTGAFEFHKLKDHFVTYAAYPGETPVISGGRKLGPWRRERERWVADAPGLDLTRLLANGHTQTLARTPGTGYFTPAEMTESPDQFTFRDEDLKQWPGMENNRIVMLLRWHRGVNSIASVDTTDNVVRLAEPQPGITVVPPRYYVENVEALLDTPGEWFYAADTGKLSYIPEAGMDDPNMATMVTPVLSQLLVVEGEPQRPVRNLRLYGLNFESTNPGDGALSFAYATACECVDLSLRGLGNTALQFGKGCYLNRILGNTIQGADEGGISMCGEAHPDWVDLVHGNTISHNRVSNCGGTSVRVNNSRDTVISHNEITETRGRTPLQVGGWSNVEVAIDGGYRIEYNHIHHVQDEADDSGAITTTGLTRDSIIRFNLIHDVRAGFFNDNVAVWFDNMSSGWTIVDNIYFNLEQSEMKLCASVLEDNMYRDNWLIESPASVPEGILEGHPEFDTDELRIESADGGVPQRVVTGQILKASATVRNAGETGVSRVDLYVDGKIAESRKFAVVRNSDRTISFDLVFHEPGRHEAAIGATLPQVVVVGGETLRTLHRDLEVSATVVPLGEDVAVSATVQNVTDRDTSEEVEFRVDEQIAERKSVPLAPGESRRVRFLTRPDVGLHRVSVGGAGPACLEAYPHNPVNIAKAELHTHVSGTARPCEFTVDQVRNRYTIKASGTDLLHAEDSYGAIYLKGVITGNFTATVKVVRYQSQVNPWYRAGLFVRNDLSRSHETEPGSLGSVLLYTTPKLAGIQWDEHGDGCMHKSGGGGIHDQEPPFPVWLRLVRHGDTFSGYTSGDGEHWGDPWSTDPVPGLADAMDIGIAAGTIDQVPALVELEDFALELEDIG
ncbi:MAG TPA: right-handed parallel beta-helix repeat-containing protein [Candidatus Latescibacteria bacterium]|nr:right-handed parallel beta-helix repeat-containing protein [Candidatus Latescibacterota bacterium]HJP32435.1 right-handed parallel beta-helix repeat-containing protein [Candidatus Latescibacterota bacterium]